MVVRNLGFKGEIKIKRDIKYEASDLMVKQKSKINPGLARRQEY